MNLVKSIYPLFALLLYGCASHPSPEAVPQDPQATVKTPTPSVTSITAPETKPIEPVAVKPVAIEPVAKAEITEIDLTPPPLAPESSVVEVESAVKVESAAEPEEYRIKPEDSLEIQVFQVAELSGIVQVDANGQAEMPLLGKVKAAGLTSEELATDLERKFGADYLQDPQVTVVVQTPADN